MPCLRKPPLAYCPWRIIQSAKEALPLGVQLGEKWEPYYETGIVETARNSKKETNMPIILWFLGVPLVLVVLLMLTHVI
jgi:hypothetical protein